MLMNRLANVYDKVAGLLKNNFNNLIFYFLVSMVFYGIFVKLNFTPDTYNYTYNTVPATFRTFMGSGRVFTAFAMVVFKSIPWMTTKIACFISFCLAILMLVVSLCVLDSLIERIVKNKWVKRLITILIIINPFLIELFMFIEKGIMVSGICFSIVATKYFVLFMSNKDNNDNKNDWLNLLKSAAFLILACFCYQGTIGVFVVLSCIFAIKYSKNWRPFIKNLFLTGVIYASSALAGLIIVRTMHVSTRTDSSLNVLDSIGSIFNGLPMLINMFNLYPVKILIISSLAILLVVGISILISDGKKKLVKLTKYIASTVFIYLVTLIASVAPQIALNKNYIWIVPRSAYVYGMVFGSIILVAMLYVDSSIKIIRHIYIIMIVILSVNLGIQFYRTNSVEIDHYNVIALDRDRVLKIKRLIEQYEERTDNEIERISAAEDGGGDTVTYPYVFNVMDLNDSSFRTSWSSVESIKYWGGIIINKEDPPAEFINYCKSHDWQEFDEEQIVFDGNWAGICIWNQYAK